VTTTWVLVEIGDALATTRHRQWFPDFAADLASAAQIRIIAASDEWFRRGVAFYRARPDKKWSLTDCLSFELMRELGVREALTSDQHFEQAGFRALLRD
jgi:predicted nucleic acid-binding protein